MGLLSGGGLKGLFANPDTGNPFTQARAFLDGDYGTGIDIAARRFRNRRHRSGLDAARESNGGLTVAGPADAAALAPPAPSAPPIGAILDGHRYLGGDPGQESSWQPLGGTALGSGIAIPGDFGRGY